MMGRINRTDRIGQVGLDGRGEIDRMVVWMSLNR